MTYRGSVPPQSRIDFIKSLQLESFAIIGVSLPIAICQQLAQGLSPSLRDLTIKHRGSGDAEQLYFDSSPQTHPVDMAPLPLPIRPYDAPVWIVRNTYPRLESFKTEREPREAFLLVEFLAGLPETIVDLSFTMAASLILNAIPMLPRYLSHIRLVGTLAHEGFSDLTSMNLLPRRDLSYLNFGRWSTSTLSPLDAKGCSFPASLTDLRVDCLAEDLPKLPPFPSLLRSLQLLEDYSPFQFDDPKQLFQLVPPSLTKLDFSGKIEILSGNVELLEGAVGGHSERSGAGAEKRPSIKFLRIYESQLSDETLHSQIISLVPNLEDFWLGTCNYAITPHHIRSFNGALLRHLHAPLSIECFVKADDGTYPLVSALPSLKVLYVEESLSETAETFDFGSIPPSVTDFHSVLTGHTSETLHLLPLSITRINVYGEMTGLIETENFDQLFRPYSPPSASLEGNNASDPKDGRKLLLVYSMYLVRMDDGMITFSTSPKEGFLGEIRWLWSSKIPYELLEGCTEVLLGHNITVNAPLNGASPNLPHLTKLCALDYSVTSLGHPTSLADLSVVRYVDPVYPPNLTRLDCKLKDFSLPLPYTLIHLSCAMPTPSMLAGLNLLQTFEDTSAVSTYVKNDWRGALPTSLTKLSLPGDHFCIGPQQSWSRDDFSIHFFDRLPRLKTLKIVHTLPVSLVDLLLDTTPAHVELKCRHIDDSAIRNMAAIAKHAKVSHGTLELLPHETALSALSRVYSRATKRFFSSRKQISRDYFTSLVWSSFCPLIAQNTTELRIHDFSILFDENDVVYLPPAITTLICDSISKMPGKPVELPPQLRKLVINPTTDDYSCESVFTLPSSLTHLDVKHMKLRLPSINWPSNLTYLRVSLSPLWVGSNISSLPTSLRSFYLVNPLLPLSLFSSLPRDLKVFGGTVAAANYEVFIEHARNTGLTWIVAPTVMVMEFGDTDTINFESSLDVLASAHPNIKM